MAQFTRSQFDNMSKDEKDELMKKKSDRPSARPMGDIYPQTIKRILEGETPKITLSMYDRESTMTDEEKQERLDEATERENRHKLFADLRKETNPTFCPKCGKFMSDRLDTKFFAIRKTCYTCVIKFERKIRDAGLWRQYEDKIMNDNKLSFLRDVKQEVEDYLFNGGLKRQYEYVTEEGKIEKWTNDAYDETKVFLENTLKEIITIQEDLSSYLNELNEVLKNDVAISA